MNKQPKWWYTEEDYETISIPKDCIPAGGKLVEAYETEREIIVCGDPEPEPEGLSKEEMEAWYENSHNCDAMGCGTLSHVTYRFDKAEIESLRARVEALEAALRASRDALQNMLGGFDTPLRRMQLSGEFYDEAIESARAAEGQARAALGE
jgi:hypothetical protein